MASEFLQAYHELVRLAGNDPVGLGKRAKIELQLQAACDRVSAALTSIRITERYSTEQYTHTVPKQEVEARRDYDRRWSRAVFQTDRLLGELVLAPPETQEKEPDPDLAQLDAAIADGQYQANKFNLLIDRARDQIDNQQEWEEWPEWAYEALTVWDDLRMRTGFDLASVLARLELVPFVLIPADISKHHGSGETFSLFQRLKDAQRAFVFGSYLACAALQRSILEDVLRRNYAAPGKNLPDRINAAVLPWGLTTSDLHEINKLGNDVLHVDRSPNLDSQSLIRTLVAGLEALQKLIEGAPASLKSGQ